MKNTSFKAKRMFLLLALLVVVATVSAQALRTGYFLKGNSYRYRINPAYMSEHGHISVPLLGGVQATTMGNVSFDDLFMENPLTPGEYITFMDDKFDTDDFLGGLEDENMVRMNMDMVLLSAGFHAFGGFNTIDVSLRSQTAVNVPYGMFHFMKVANPILEGILDGRIPAGDVPNFAFDEFNIYSRNFVDVSLGHSRKFGKNLTLGARAKLLFGLGYANVNVDNMSIEYNNFNSWAITAHADADIAFGGEFKYSDNKLVNGTPAVVGYDHFDPGLQGFGLGLDFGATYDMSDVVKGLVLSASVNDLGFIKWNKSTRAALNGDNYEFGGFDIESAIVGEYSLSDQLSDLGEDLEDFFLLEDRGENSVTSGIGAKVNLGAEYVMPFYDKMSAGFLYTHCFDDVYSYNQASLMLSVAPVKFLDFALSGTSSTFGTGFGALVNFHCPGFNLFVGTDCFFSTQEDYFVPNKDMNGSVSFGINVAFGGGSKKNKEKAE